MSSSYGIKLKQIRNAEGLTQPEFGKETGVSLGSIRNYETGQKEVGLKVIDNVINTKRFKKYTLWLMTGETSPEIGQISPALSPDGLETNFNSQRGQKVG